MANELTDRERTVLRCVVRDFIETATPVGSRYVSRRHEDILGLSSASIRNVMSDLELLGYIAHPHTSAGRVPPDLGHRFYINSLIEMQRLTEKEQQAIRRDLNAADEADELLRDSSKILSRISHQLCVVTSPQLSSGTMEKIELVPLMANRIMVVISIKSGLVKTIMLEVASEIRREKLEELSRFLNERLYGLTLQQIRESFSERVKDVQYEETGLIRLFIDSVDKLFPADRIERIHISGADTIIDQPEFVNPRDFRSVIELINNEEIFIHVLEKNPAPPNEINVTIGEENKDEKLKHYSVITSRYAVGDVTGSIGVFGPTRMSYDRMIPLVDYVAKTISEMISTTNRTS
jgi:heat-inducible transcriptional repressor